MPAYSAKIALLGSVIDYAGTFPPAALPLPEAMKVAAAFRRRAKHSWLLSKIALPLEDLKKLGAKILYESGGDGSGWLYTALGSPITEAADCLRAVEWDFRELRRCNQRGINSSLRQWILSYETKIPVDVLSGGGMSLQRLLDKFAALTHFSTDLFLEFPVDGQWRDRVSMAAEVMARWNDTHGETDWSPGLKFRTGGAAVPTADDLAFAVATCVSHGLRFKATQGLHHAVTQGNEYGFVNLFAALCFAQALGIDVFGGAIIADCLREQSASRFQFGDRTLRWNEFEIDVEGIEAARRRHGATFGSCSLDEPDESLDEVFKS